jgi:hypothetical protein
MLFSALALMMMSSEEAPRKPAQNTSNTTRILTIEIRKMRFSLIYASGIRWRSLDAT